MASKSENSFAKLVANFGRLIEFCIGYGTNYNPSKTRLSISNLQAKHAQAKATIELVGQKDNEYDTVEGERIDEFKGLSTYSTRLVNALASTDATGQKLEEARGFQKKLRGERATEKPVDEEGKDISISASQMSYDNQVEHFYRLSLVLASEPTYEPNESDLTITAVNDRHAQLEAKNKSVAKADTASSNARISRNKELYEDKNGIVDTAKEVKKYVASVFGASSPEYKQISGIEFREKKK